MKNSIFILFVFIGLTSCSSNTNEDKNEKTNLDETVQSMDKLDESLKSTEIEVKKHQHEIDSLLENI